MMLRGFNALNFQCDLLNFASPPEYSRKVVNAWFAKPKIAEDVSVVTVSVRVINSGEQVAIFLFSKFQFKKLLNK